jgi:SMC interacting uncharacterized protein involved in chromosome segregation
MSSENNERPSVDPFSQMFQFYDQFYKSWGNVMSEAVANKRFAESMGEQMESSLEAMSVMRAQFSDMMEQYLQQINLPTHKEMSQLAERITKIEMGMDDLDAKLDEVLDLLNSMKK